jgi:hypothetical protein
MEMIMFSDDERFTNFLRAAAEFYEAGAEKLPVETRNRVAHLVGSRQAELVISARVTDASANVLLVPFDGEAVELFSTVAPDEPERMH